MEDLNRKFVELLNGCWHETAWKKIKGRTPGGKSWDKSCFVCVKCGERHAVNPDFAADPVALLREMRKREDWPRFLDSIDGMHNCYDYGQEIIWRDWIEISYILDTGQLLKAAWKWMKEREEEV